MTGDTKYGRVWTRLLSQDGPFEVALGGGQSNCPEDYVRPYASHGNGRRTAAKLFLQVQKHTQRHVGPIKAAPIRRYGGGSEGTPIPRQQLSASISGLSGSLGVERGDCKRASVQLTATLARRPRSRRAERQLKRRGAKGTTATVGCASMAARAARQRA